jgi:hypothetical protein
MVEDAPLAMLADTSDKMMFETPSNFSTGYPMDPDPRHSTKPMRHQCDITHSAKSIRHQCDISALSVRDWRAFGPEHIPHVRRGVSTGSPTIVHQLVVVNQAFSLCRETVKRLGGCSGLINQKLRRPGVGLRQCTTSTKLTVE